MCPNEHTKQTKEQKQEKLNPKRYLKQETKHKRQNEKTQCKGASKQCATRKAKDRLVFVVGGRKRDLSTTVFTHVLISLGCTRPILYFVGVILDPSGFRQHEHQKTSAGFAYRILNLRMWLLQGFLLCRCGCHCLAKRALTLRLGSSMPCLQGSCSAALAA